MRDNNEKHDLIQILINSIKKSHHTVERTSPRKHLVLKSSMYIEHKKKLPTS